MMAKFNIVRIFIMIIFTTCLVNSTFAKSFLTYEEFKQLDIDQKVKIIDQIRSVVVDIEFQYKKNPKLKKSVYHKNILKLWNNIISNAYADHSIDMGKVNGVNGNELCMFAGWPSLIYYDSNRGYNVCMHPAMIQYNTSLSPEKKKLGENYTNALKNVKTQCNAYQGIVCNPTLFGKIDYCALGKNIDENQNSSLDCWRVAKEHKTDETLAKDLTQNNKLSEDFHQIFKMVYGMCLCNGTYKDTDGKRKRFVSESYAKYAMGHRTCAGLLNQTRALTDKMSMNCSEITSPSIDNVSNFLFSVNETVDGYLTDVMYKGDGSSQEYYEDLIKGSTSRTNIEYKKRAERQAAAKSLEDDLYCGKDFYEKKETVHPKLVITPNDLGSTYTFEVVIDFSSSTNKKKEDYQIIVKTNPDTKTDKIENNIYTYTKNDTKIEVIFELKYKDGKIVDTSEKFEIPPKSNDNKKFKLELEIAETTEEFITYKHKVTFNGTDITSEKEKYKLVIKYENGKLVEDSEIVDFKIKYKIEESDYKVVYTLKDKSDKEVYDKTITIQGKKNTDDEKNRIEVVLVADSDVEKIVQYKHTIYINNIDVTAQADKYTLEIKNAVTLLEIANKKIIDVSTFEYIKEDKEYKVLYTATDIATKEEIGTKEVTVHEIGKTSDNYLLGILSEKFDKEYQIQAQLFESTDTEKKTPLTEMPDGYSIVWYKADEIQTEKNFDSFKRERLKDKDYTLTAKLLKDDTEIDTDSVDIEKIGDNTDSGDDFSIEITKADLVDGTYKVEATLKVDGKVVTVLDGYEIKWEVTAGTTTDSEDLLDELDETKVETEETQTVENTLKIDVKQSELNKTATITVKKGDKEKSDSELLKGTGINIDDDDDDDTDRTIGSNGNPYQQRTTPPTGLPKPKMILRGKDGHQGRWGY